MTKILNLIRPDASNISYNIIKFPDGESHIILEEFSRKDSVTIKCRIVNAEDLFILMQVSDILQRQSVQIECIDIYYLMGMRMDRVISFNESFSLKLVANVINSFNADYVRILEPHSNRVFDLIKNSSIMPIEDPIDFGKYVTILPDEGASKRYALDQGSIICSKTRDLSTGKITGFSLDNKDFFRSFKDKLSYTSFLVIDDLCDGGGTFIGIKELLTQFPLSKNQTTQNKLHISILVTHMVNPQGIKNLSIHYDKVYITNSYKDWQHENLPSNVIVIGVV